MERDQQKKRDAIKKVIAYMTLGIDVSPLFSEMVMASATTDLVQKKMDCRDDDPMIRDAAAVDGGTVFGSREN